MESIFNPGYLMGAFLTLGIISFLYKDNPWYKFCEALFVGISAGYWFCTVFWSQFVAKLWDNIYPTAGQPRQYVYLVGGILGLMMLLRLVPKIGWFSRWPLAFVVGGTAGAYLIGYALSNGMKQVKSTILPLWVSGNLNATVGNIILVVGTFCGLIYFFFSKEQKGTYGKVAKLGIFFLMITFGASFGYTVMARMSLLIGRMDFLFGTWLGLIK
ncbi:MAG: hypothetical protein A2V73_04465 [candidate division Zixibacteria bacterium RBG_19FT_COMBO_42_43]|nr:MAG: hypothetical protein A2V73_04465 [candidate division Zixibacteria bacterium RBG_19FT_COMBO_42_43]